MGYVWFIWQKSKFKISCCNSIHKYRKIAVCVSMYVCVLIVNQCTTLFSCLANLFSILRVFQLVVEIWQLFRRCDKWRSHMCAHIWPLNATLVLSVYYDEFVWSGHLSRREKKRKSIIRQVIFVLMFKTIFVVVLVDGLIIDLKNICKWNDQNKSISSLL